MDYYELMRPQRSTSTDRRFDRVPESTKGYVLPTYVLPGRDINTERDAFAGMAFRNRWTMAEAESRWDSHCRSIIAANDQVEKAVNQARDNQYGMDFRHSPLEAEAEKIRIMSDPAHAFNLPLHPHHEPARLLMVALQEIISGQRQVAEDGRASMAGYLTPYLEERRERQRLNNVPRASSNNVSEADLWGTRQEIPLEDPQNIGPSTTSQPETEETEE